MQEDLHVKDYLLRMKDRMNLQMLGSYIRDGSIRTRFDDKPYYKRIGEDSRKLEEIIDSLLRDPSFAGKMNDAISEYEDTIVDVYFSIGMKVGAQLNHLLMSDFDKDF